MKRVIKQALRAGEDYDFNLVLSFFEPILDDYNDCLSTIENVNEVWQGRGGEYVDVVAYVLAEEFSLSRMIDAEIGLQEYVPTGDLHILGYPVIGEGECIDNEGRVRGQILLTIDELAEYIAPIPPSIIAGIVLIRGENGEHIGFSICAVRHTS